jgi:hypothetical protein
MKGSIKRHIPHGINVCSQADVVVIFFLVLIHLSLIPLVHNNSLHFSPNRIQRMTIIAAQICASHTPVLQSIIWKKANMCALCVSLCGVVDGNGSGGGEGSGSGLSWFFFCFFVLD